MSKLSEAALSSWRANAQFWDEGVGIHGNKYWKRLQEPSLQRLLGAHLRRQRSECPLALDLATGNGLSARWLAARGAAVMATDGCLEMIELAKNRSHDEAGNIMFVKLDVTDERAWKSLTKGPRFDVVLMNMAMMDIATLDPLADALPKILKKDGVFVATMLHPVFFTSTHSRNVDLRFNPQTGEQEIVRSKVITEYLHVKPAKGVAAIGQPVKQIYFHRPLHEILGTFFKRGLVLDALEEPSFTESDEMPGRLESTANFTQLPALMSMRFRRAA